MAQKEAALQEDPMVVADFSADNIDNPAEGSRREMLSGDGSVRPSKAGGAGGTRFDPEDGGADDMPENSDDGGGFF